MAKKICLMGAHGVGKTTLLKKYEQQGYKIYTEIVRDLMRLQVVSPSPTREEQGLIYQMKASQFTHFINSESDAVIDRSPFDVLVYTYQGKMDWDLILDDQWKPKPIEYIYIRANEGFHPEADAYRSGDPVWFAKIQGEFDTLYEAMKDRGYHIKILKSSIHE